MNVSFFSMTANKLLNIKLLGEINQYLNHIYLQFDYLSHYLTLKSIVHFTTYVMVLKTNILKRVIISADLS